MRYLSRMKNMAKNHAVICLIAVTLLSCGKLNSPSLEPDNSNPALSETAPWLAGVWQSQKIPDKGLFLDGATMTFVRDVGYQVGRDDDPEFPYPTVCDWRESGSFGVFPTSKSDNEYYIKQGNEPSEWTIKLRSSKFEVNPSKPQSAKCVRYIQRRNERIAAAALQNSTYTSEMNINQVSTNEFQDTWHNESYNRIDFADLKSRSEISISFDRYLAATVKFKLAREQNILPLQTTYEAEPTDILKAFLIRAFSVTDGLVEKLVLSQKACAVSAKVAIPHRKTSAQNEDEDKLKSALKEDFLPCLQQVLLELSYASQGSLAQKIGARLSLAHELISQF
jgi:hypothetical protein